MVKTFELLFRLRYVKKVKLKVRLKDYFYILKFYNRNKLYKEMKWKIFYYIIIQNCIKNIITFEKACNEMIKIT